MPLNFPLLSAENLRDPPSTHNLQIFLCIYPFFHVPGDLLGTAYLQSAGAYAQRSAYLWNILRTENAGSVLDLCASFHFITFFRRRRQLKNCRNSASTQYAFRSVMDALAKMPGIFFRARHDNDAGRAVNNGPGAFSQKSKPEAFFAF